MDAKIFGEMLGAHRKAAGLSYDKVAKMCNTSKSYIYELEKGVVSNPSLFVAQKIANNFGYTLSEFLQEEKAAVVNGDKIRKLAQQIIALTK